MCATLRPIFARRGHPRLQADRVIRRWSKWTIEWYPHAETHRRQTPSPCAQRNDSRSKTFPHHRTKVIPPDNLLRIEITSNVSMPRSTPFYIGDVKKVKALASPVRAAIIDVLEVLGPATVVQVADSLGYPPTAFTTTSSRAAAEWARRPRRAGTRQRRRTVPVTGPSRHAPLSSGRRPSADRHREGRGDDGQERRAELPAGPLRRD